MKVKDFINDLQKSCFSEDDDVLFMLKVGGKRFFLDTVDVLEEDFAEGPIVGFTITEKMLNQIRQEIEMTTKKRKS